MPDIIGDKDVKIRKEQRCFGCARKFPPGTVLARITSVDSGVFATTYWCDVCRIYWKEHMLYDDEINFGELRDQDPEEWERIYLKRQALKGGE